MVGALEVIGGLMLLLGIVPRLVSLALIGNMIGALATAGRVDGGQDIWLPIVLIVLLAIVAEQRTIAGPDSEASVHQIRVELDGRSPDDTLAAVRDWAQSCIADRHIEIEEA